MTTGDIKERCPHQRLEAAYDFEHDKVYDGPAMCKLNDKVCLLESGLECETYEEFLRELESEKEPDNDDLPV